LQTATLEKQPTSPIGIKDAPASVNVEGPLESVKYEPLWGLTGLVDADILCYRCAFVAEHTYYALQMEGTEIYVQYDNAVAMKAEGLGGTAWTRKEVQPVEFALQAIKTTIASIQEKSKAKELKFYLSGKTNFRDDVAVTKPYKGNRDAVARPVHWRACRDYLVGQYGATITTDIEADDAIGTDLGRLGDTGFICTIDKDLDQIAGWHYNWVKGEVYRVTKREADFNLYSQIIAGDSTDNIPGLGGFGDAKARKYLEGCTSTVELFRRTWDLYKSKSGFPTPEGAWNYMIEQAKLVYILRYNAAPYNTPLTYAEVFGLNV
jgi:hypothetical protein